MKLNGWQRIWVVLSVIFCVTGSALILYEVISDWRADYKEYNSELKTYDRYTESNLTPEKVWRLSVGGDQILDQFGEREISCLMRNECNKLNRGDLCIKLHNIERGLAPDFNRTFNYYGESPPTCDSIDSFKAPVKPNVPKKLLERLSDALPAFIMFVLFPFVFYVLCFIVVKTMVWVFRGFKIS